MLRDHYLIIRVLWSLWMPLAVLGARGGHPPQITQHPKREVAYKEMERVQLTCEAHGSPKPQFYWEKDGVRLVLNDDVTLRNESGTLVIDKPNPSSHDGVYQCFAYNNFGVAVTTKAVLKKAEMKSFPSVHEPTIHRPVVGMPLNLTCDPPKSYPEGTVYWGENSSGAKLQPIENTDRISLDYSGSLHFSNIVADDELRSPTAHYLCAVYNPVLRSVVQGDDQRIEPEPGSPRYRAPQLMWSSSHNDTAIKGQTKKMKCIFSGYPTPSVTWTRLDASLPDRAKISSFGQEIVINEVSYEDAGQYRCSANNSESGQIIKQDFNVVVESVPYWRQGRLPEDVTAAEDEVVHFECFADGVPPPTVSWSFNGRPSNEYMHNGRLTVSGNKVTFHSVVKNDSQVLQCNASNIHGYILANAFLLVRAEPPSVLQALPAMSKIAKDQSVTLHCRMDGAPKPVIQWTRGDSKKPVAGERFRIHSNGDLKILSASLDDMDTYYCTGKNKLGNETVDGQLIVREKTLITEQPQSQTIKRSGHAKFVCKATTDPHERLTITWYKDGQLLDLSSHINPSFILVNDSLIIDSAQVSDSGEYKCRADNKIDSDEFSAQLVVKDRPAAPTNVQINSCVTHRAEVSWTASVDNNDPIQEYVVFYNTSYDPLNSYKEAARTKSTKATIHPLHPWTNYTFHVTARNSIGLSDHSAFTQAVCSTPQAKPYRNPTDVCTRNGNPEELVITWKPMQRHELNGENFHYKVTYRPAPEEEEENDSKKENVTTVVIRDWQQSEIVFAKQGIYKRFKISVLAANNEGAAPDKSVENIFGHSTEGVPSVIPENLRIQEKSLNSTSVRFMWDPVNTSSDSVNGFFKGFQVRFWKRGNRYVVRTEDLILNDPPAYCVLQKKSSKHSRVRRSSDPFKLLTHRLWGGATINAAVVVLNGANAGELSDVIEFMTPEGVPEAVYSLSVSERGTHHLKLEWQPPFEINGILDHFVIGYRALNSSSLSTFMTVIANPQQTTAKLHGLQPETTYTIFVKAHTLTGGGPTTYTQDSTIALMDPLDVPYIDELETGEDFVVVTWQPSREKPAKNPGSKFVLEYHTKDMSEQNTSSVEMHYNWINLTGLTPSKTYEIVVVAMNQAGEKTRSAPKTFALGLQPEPILHTSGMGGWFIGLIVAILLLLLILLLICFIKHRRQGKYPVYKKEKLHGCNPDNSEEEPKFGEYTKSSALPVLPTGQGSMDSIEKPLESDTNSLAEYEDTDPTKFNEDGSFIGQYGGQKKVAPTADHNAPFATIV